MSFNPCESHYDRFWKKYRREAYKALTKELAKLKSPPPKKRKSK